MSTVAKKDSAVPSPKEFRSRTEAMAKVMLTDWVGDQRAREATGRIATAISASAASARNPQDFYECTPASVAKVIAISALTGIMPSTGQGALAYAIPRRPRKGEPPHLQYQLSHRGIAALAHRAGMSLIAIPISVRDVIDVNEVGDVVVKSRDLINPAMSDADLVGVAVVVRSHSSGVVVCRQFVPKALIHQRRDTSDAYLYAQKPGNEWAKDSDPWHKWPVEMAMKTAMHYAVARGWCVIDDTSAVRALQADVESDSTLTIDAGASQNEALIEHLMGGVGELEEAKK